MPARLDFSAKDESFQPDSGQAYSLLLAIGKDDFRFAIVDQKANTVVALEQYHLSGSYNPQQLASELDQLLKTHTFLGRKKWVKVSAVYAQSSSCLFPESLLEDGHAAEYFALQHPVDLSKEQVLKHLHSNLEVVMLHSCPKELVGWLQKIPSENTQKLTSPLSLLLNLSGQINNKSTEPRLYGLALAEMLHLVIYDNGRLIFCNSFPFKTPQDLVYFLLLAMQENGLNPEQHQVMLWGEFMPDSALFNLVRLYVRNVQPGKRPSGLNYSSRLDDRFQHLDAHLYGQISFN
jgi:hypothetical protein